MSWDYADLSHVAKEAGGPQALVNAIFEGGVFEGRIQGGVIGAILTLAAGGIGYGVKRIYDRRKVQACQAKAALIEQIEGFDDESRNEGYPQEDKQVQAMEESSSKTDSIPQKIRRLSPSSNDSEE